jgi:hypothetical protein
MQITPTHKIEEVLNPSEFQHLLRTMGQNLEGCIVNRPSELEPHLVDVEGGLQIYGEPHFWSTKCDLRGIKSAEDIFAFIGALEKSFEKAAAQLSRPA